MTTIWQPLPLMAAVEREEDGTYVATLPDVEDLQGEGRSATEAVKDLTHRVFFALRMG